MSANFESGMFVREKPWHYEMTKDTSKILQEAPTSEEALIAAGLDWNVVQKPLFVDGLEVPNWKANVRDKDNTILGIVTDRYKVVQNKDAFAFTDNLIGGDVRYETAGSLMNGRKVWMLAKLPSEKVLGDEVEPYLCFSNTHDGTGAVKVCMTPIRVVCNNTLNFALNTAKRAWSVRHTGNIETRIHEAQDCLRLAHEYMDGLDVYADRLANKKIMDEDIKNFLDELFPVDEKATDREKNTVQKAKDEYYVCYYAPDIKQFRGTAWGALNAMTDMVAHSRPARLTQNYEENNWNRIMNGHILVDKLAGILTR